MLNGLLAKSLNQVQGTLHVNSWTKAPKKVPGTDDEDLASEPIKESGDDEENSARIIGENWLILLTTAFSS